MQSSERRHLGNHSDVTFSRLIRSVSRGRKKCPNDCGRMIETRTSLMNSPDVISIGIIWDSEEPCVENISELLHTINTSVKLQDMYHHVLDKSVTKHEYHLSSIVCYYGKHYTTFFHNLKTNRWVSIDDASVTEIGKHWKDVLHKCIKGHHQPLLLIYTNRSPVPVSLVNAPTAIKMAPSSVKSSPALLKREDPGSASSSSDFETQPWIQIARDQSENPSTSPGTEILQEVDFAEKLPYYSDDKDGASDSSSSIHWRKESLPPPVPKRRDRKKYEMENKFLSVKYRDDDSNSLDDNSSSSSSPSKEKRHPHQDESSSSSSSPYREKYADISKSRTNRRSQDKYSSRRMRDEDSNRDDYRKKYPDHSEASRRKQRSPDEYAFGKYKYDDSRQDESSRRVGKKDSDPAEKYRKKLRSPEKITTTNYEEDSNQDDISDSSSSPYRERKRLPVSKNVDEDDLIDGFSSLKLQDNRVILPSKEQKSPRRNKALNSKSYALTNGTSVGVSARDKRRSRSQEDELDDKLSSGKYTPIDESRKHPEKSRVKRPPKRIDGQAKTLPNSNSSKFRFQWHVANDSKNHNIGSYVEPSVAKWTTYKPYERQTSHSQKRDFDLYKL